MGWLKEREGVDLFIMFYEKSDTSDLRQIFRQKNYSSPNLLEISFFAITREWNDRSNLYLYFISLLATRNLQPVTCFCTLKPVFLSCIFLCILFLFHYILDTRYSILSLSCTLPLIIIGWSMLKCWCRKN